VPDYGSVLTTPSGISCTICCRGGELELSGDKWWTTGACLPTCAICIFMGKTDAAAAPHKQQSMVLVPMDAPGQCMFALPGFS
jgi:alkylation response protein AidB-like acyl-CoA dehydrogenase